MRGPLRQSEVYVAGIGGRRPRVPVEWAKLEARAREAMRPEAFAYIATGAGAEATLDENRAAFGRHRIVPRVLRDVGERDTSVTIFGRRFPGPFMIAPIGVLEMAHRHADLAVARAARAEGVPMIISNQASHPMEAIADELGDTARWFQLYWSVSDELVESLVSRAEAAGAEAIVVTLDTTLLGWRTRDLDLGYLPFLRGKGIAQYTSDPVFRRLAAEGGSSDTPTPRPSLGALRTLAQIVRSQGSIGTGRASVQKFIEIYSRPSLSWDDLPFLRERTKLKILLKGVLHPDDAARAIEAGIDGIIVSNHGGRQIDGEIATLDALPGVVKAVDGRVPVLLDSGIRGGADAFKAVALGATAVLIGRPYVYGLAVAGENGVREILRNLHAEFDLTMGLAGCRAVSEIGPEALRSP